MNTTTNDEHWLELIIQCKSSGLTDRQWCIENGIPVSNWQCISHRKAPEASQNPLLPVVAETESLSAAQRTVSFAEIRLQATSPDASSIFYPDSVIWKGNLGICLCRINLSDRRNL